MLAMTDFNLKKFNKAILDIEKIINNNSFKSLKLKNSENVNKLKRMSKDDFRIIASIFLSIENSKLSYLDNLEFATEIYLRGRVI